MLELKYEITGSIFDVVVRPIIPQITPQLKVAIANPVCTRASPLRILEASIPSTVPKPILNRPGIAGEPFS
jgi:hypothetical protein